MNRKLKRLFEPNMRFYFIILVFFSVITFFFGGYTKELAAIELAFVVLVYIYSKFAERKRSREILNYIETVTHSVDAATNDTLQNFPLPMAIFSIDEGTIVYSNDYFMKMTGSREHFFEVKFGDVVPGFSSKWLMEGKNECPDLVEVNGREYKVYGNILRTEIRPGVKGYAATTYWVDETDYYRMKTEYTKSRPVFSILMLDNYDEFLKGLSDKDKSAYLSMIDDRISEWAGDCGGYLCKYDRDRYIFAFEERYLQRFVDGKFSLLDSVREITSPTGIQATLSIGIGKDGKTLEENYQFASLSIEMALSRGGDQAVIKNRFNFEFYGGRSSEMEKRTKVKSRVMENSLSELMGDASSILVMGHKYSDLDCIGSAVGICCIARRKGRKANIVVDMSTTVAENLIKRMETLPEYRDTFISPQDAILQADGKTLLIVVDTNRPEQVESETLLFSCNRIAIIDHHRRAATYIQNAALSFHEPYASSAAELVSELLQYIVEQSDILRFEAEALLSGIVLDTKNFTMRTGGRTFDAAAFLRRAGADTTEVKKFLQSNMNTAKLKYNIILNAKIYKEGIAVSVADGPQDRVIAAQAADELLNIEGIEASFVIYEEEAWVSISARSIGDINVQMVVEKLGGGGNKSTAGAQIQDKPKNEVLNDLLRAIDWYMENNGSAQ